MDSIARARYSSPRTRPVLINRPDGAPGDGSPPRLCLRCSAAPRFRSSPLVGFGWAGVLPAPSRR